MRQLQLSYYSPNNFLGLEWVNRILMWVGRRWRLSKSFRISDFNLEEIFLMWFSSDLRPFKERFSTELVAIHSSRVFCRWEDDDVINFNRNFGYIKDILGWVIIECIKICYRRFRLSLLIVLHRFFNWYRDRWNIQTSILRIWSCHFWILPCLCNYVIWRWFWRLVPFEVWWIYL